MTLSQRLAFALKASCKPTVGGVCRAKSNLEKPVCVAAVVSRRLLLTNINGWLKRFLRLHADARQVQGPPTVTAKAP